MTAGLWLPCSLPVTFYLDEHKKSLLIQHGGHYLAGIGCPARKGWRVVVQYWQPDPYMDCSMRDDEVGTRIQDDRIV